MSIFSRILGHSKSTLRGLGIALGAAASAGIVGAAQQFAQTGQVSDMKPYIAAAVAAAVPAVVGAFSEDEAPKPSLSDAATRAATAIEEAGTLYASRKADEVIAKLQEQIAEATAVPTK
jgi:hypothetical protein